MTTIKTGLDTTNKGCFTAVQSQCYFANNFDPMQVWNGISSTSYDAGIAGPATAPTAPSAAGGATSNGAHLIRYRYRNSKTGYVSSPSPALLVTVSGGNGALTFTTGAANYVVSGDAKVDFIDFEMTAVNGQIFYRAGSVLNSGTTITVAIADTSLIQQFNCDANYGTVAKADLYSHEQPPIGTICLAYRGRMFVAGDAPYTKSLAMSNGSATINGTGFSTKWAGKLLRVASESVAYVIQSSTATVITLTQVWTGVSTTYSCSIYSGTPNRVYYSRASYPESFYAAVFARDVLNGRSDQLSAMVGRKDALYLLGKYSGERLVFNDDPSAASSVLSPIQGNRGAFHQRVLVEAEGSLYSFDRQGIYLVNEIPQHLSNPVDDTLTELVDYDQSALFHGVFDPRDRVLMWFFVRTGDTQCKYAMCMELDTGVWWVNYFFQGVAASKIVPTSDGQVRVMLSDENGYTWFFGIEGSFDGVPSSSPSVITVNGVATTTNIPVDETLPASPSLAGAIAYNPANGETAVVSSNTSSALTLGAGLTVAPADNAEMYLGPIAWEWRSKFWVGQGQQDKKRPAYFHVYLYPGTATGKMRLAFYGDFGDTPLVFTSGVNDEFPDGVNLVDGQSYVEIDLDGGNGDGFVPVPIPDGTWRRAIQARLTSVRPDGAMRLVDYKWAMSDKDEREADDE